MSNRFPHSVAVLLLALLTGCGETDPDPMQKSKTNNPNKENTTSTPKPNATQKSLEDHLKQQIMIDITKNRVMKVSVGLSEYNFGVGQLPPETDVGLSVLVEKPTDADLAEKWRGPYATASDLKDAWGMDLNYELLEPGKAIEGFRFKLWSNGPDRQSNTADDLGNWDIKKWNQ